MQHKFKCLIFQNGTIKTYDKVKLIASLTTERLPFLFSIYQSFTDELYSQLFLKMQNQNNFISLCNLDNKKDIHPKNKHNTCSHAVQINS